MISKEVLQGKPFYLTDEQVKWVYDTLGSLTLDEKIGQMFCPMGLSGDESYLRHLVEDLHIGGILYRTSGKGDIIAAHTTAQKLAKVPLLLAANLECGGDGITVDGTSMGKPMAIAATDNLENARHMGEVSATEGSAVGINWAFSPVVDLDLEFHNPITNVRTFGDDADRVIAYAGEYIKAADEQGVAATIKHFPGDGTDERDQHLVTTINRLSCEEWDATYGKIYQALIDQGVRSVMVGHIAQPAYVKHFKPDATDEEVICPGSLSKEVVTDLLRGKLGFQGLITTDSTQMMGFSSAMPRAEAIPRAAAVGCDVILFTKQLDEDQQFMKDGIASGKVSMERIDEAVTRILALKASLKLPERKANDTLIPAEKEEKIGCEQFKTWAAQAADEAVTLVRDKQNLLPISPEKYPRLYLNVIQKNLTANTPLALEWKKLFEQEGFDVTLRDRTVEVTAEDIYFVDRTTPEKRALVEEMYRSIQGTREHYDLYVYIVFMENASNNTTVRLNWNVAYGMGDDAPWHASEVPVLMISLANPYHLFDAPMVKTYINAYDSSPAYHKAVIEKVMGRSEFKGKSPVDPFCGKFYLK